MALTGLIVLTATIAVVLDERLTEEKRQDRAHQSLV